MLEIGLVQFSIAALFHAEDLRAWFTRDAIDFFCDMLHPAVIAEIGGVLVRMQHGNG